MNAGDVGNRGRCSSPSDSTTATLDTSETDSVPLLSPSPNAPSAPPWQILALRASVPPALAPAGGGDALRALDGLPPLPLLLRSLLASPLPRSLPRPRWALPLPLARPLPLPLPLVLPRTLPLPLPPQALR